MADGNGCLTPWDVQSRQIFSADGVWMTLYAGQGGGKGYVLIANNSDNSSNADAKVFNESGKGYWMEGFGCLRAEGENRPSRPNHVIVLNDQGGGVMNVSDKPSTLRAQMKHHEPIVCYQVISLKGNFIDRDTRQNGIGWNETGVQYTLDATDRHAVCYALDLQGGKGGANFLKDKCPTVLSDSHGTPHAVCYPINTMVATRGGRDDMRTTFGIGDDGDPQFTLQAAHSHAVCYEVSAFMGGQGAKARSIAYCDDGTTPALKSSPSGSNAVPDICYRVIAIEGNGARPSHLGGGVL